MKRILLVALVACLCMAIVIPAAVADGCGGYTETYTVFMPHYTETTTTTTTYGCYQQTTVEYQCPPAPCQPCPPSNCPPDPCQPVPPCAEKKAVNDACKMINKFTLGVLEQLDRELEGTGWVRLKSTRKLLKSGRCIYTVTVKNQETGEKISCFLVARTAENVVQKLMETGTYVRNGRSCDPCSRCHKQHAKCSEYSVMFVWNYNTGCNAAVYEDEWLITEYGASDGEAICEFVTKLVAEEIYRW